LSSSLSFRPHLLVSEERQRTAAADSTMDNQPFLQDSQMNPVDRFTMRLAREQGVWEETLSKEQTAFALAGVSAATILPPLTELEDGDALLDYRVRLRDYLDPSLIRELAAVLNACGQEYHWGRVDATAYASVIGAGVAVCIDVEQGNETLYLRYASTLVDKLHTARAAELPRSQLFLQTTLFERIDTLLEQTRTRTWYWLV
jgi:hypothetical protein